MSSKIVAIVIILLGLASIAYATYSYFISLRPTAGLKVSTSPPSQVYIDGKFVGISPTELYFQPGEATLSLTPQASGSAVPSYETKITLYPTVFTVVHRDFGSSESDSAGEILTLKPKSGPSPDFSLITSAPDSATVLLDDQLLGLSPLANSPVTPGNHKFSLSAPGFQTREFTALVVSGYSLIVHAKLAGAAPPIVPPPLPPEVMGKTPAPSPAPASPAPSVFVQILSTPTGFLRVRQNPSPDSPELGQVQPGSTHQLLQQLPDWYQIQVDLPSTSSGWISSQYAAKIEN